MEQCPCGSGSSAAECCAPIISGEKLAETAEQLMRARYSAYVGVNIEFIFNTTHPDHRHNYDHQGTRAWAENSDWQGLEIIATDKGGKTDQRGEVEFIARFSEKGVARQHHEAARFIKEKECWYFTEGATVKPKPLQVNKIGRNDPCNCNSGLKYKKCCGR